MSTKTRRNPPKKILRRKNKMRADINRLFFFSKKNFRKCFKFHQHLEKNVR